MGNDSTERMRCVLGDIDFALNHSTYKMARVYTKIDYSPAWELNEKVIDYIFFSNEDITKREDSGKSFERMSKYNLIRGEAFVSGECVSVIENSGFTNVEQVITRLLSSFSDNISRPSKVQIKISNLDKSKLSYIRGYCSNRHISIGTIDLNGSSKTGNSGSGTFA